MHIDITNLSHKVSVIKIISYKSHMLKILLNVLLLIAMGKVRVKRLKHSIIRI